MCNDDVMDVCALFHTGTRRLLHHIVCTR